MYMGNEAVLKDIVLGLTGDRMMDAVYLWRLAVRCKAAGCSEKVINEISRMLFSLIPGINEGTTF